jgi:GNAT superfamily N-acetyltransferase
MLAIRKAQAEDVGIILKLIRGLAEYEREPQAAVATEEDLLRDGFAADPKFYCVIAEREGIAVGFALYFFSYSTWKGRPGLYLEDLFVLPEYRGKGIGRALLMHLAKVAVDENCARYEWQVLDWNKPAIAFYEALGARQMKEWLPMRVDGGALLELARRA